MELTEALEKRKLERQKARQALDTIFDKTEPQPEIINQGQSKSLSTVILPEHFQLYVKLLPPE